MKNTVALISLRRIASNAELLKKRACAPLIAVVKDDAYGHGAEKIALFLEPQVAGFAVATADEGAALRVAGIRKEVLVLSPCVNGEEVLRLGAYGLTASVTSFAALRLLKRVGAKYRLKISAHLAVNTGMNRYGFRPAHVSRALDEARGIAVTGVYSHFYAPENESVREEQRALFFESCRAVKRRYPDAVGHLSATGGVLAGGSYGFDRVRCGIGLYGYLPAGFEGALPVKPAMRIYAFAAKSGRAFGGGAGYQAADRAYRDLTTLRFGYGDGFSRSGGKWIGKLCMDAGILEGKTTFGERRLILKDAEEYARARDTTAYEVLISAGEGAVKIYV